MPDTVTLTTTTTTMMTTLTMSLLRSQETCLRVVRNQAWLFRILQVEMTHERS
jgi:hypothetical protein